MKLEPCSREKILEMYINSELSLESTAHKIGCSVRTLQKWMKAYGIQSKGRVRFGVRKGARFSILGDKVWLKKQLETKSFRDIALEIGTTEGNISDRVKRYGLRPKGWSHSFYTQLGLKKKFPNGRFGEDAPGWRGGVSTLYNLIRASKKYKKWVELCLHRDNFTCQMCGKRGGDLEVDHIKQLALIIRSSNLKSIQEALGCNELWDINNGRVLCLECHKKTDTHSNKSFRKNKILY